VFGVSCLGIVLNTEVRPSGWGFNLVGRGWYWDAREDLLSSVVMVVRGGGGGWM